MSRRVSVPGSFSASPRSLLWRFLRVPFRGQTWLNLLYLSLLFPLGLAYFVVFVTGFAVSLALSFLLVGVPFVVALVYVAREVAAAERFVADRMLVTDVPAADDPPSRPSGVVAHVKHVFTSLSTWKGLVYLLTKFALGTAAFVLLVALGAFSGSFLFVPLYYRDVNVGIQPMSGEMTAQPSVEFALQTWQIGLTVPFRITTWYVTTLPEALAVSVLGLLMAIGSLHVCNVAARAASVYTRLLLGGTDRSEIRRLIDV